jgi:hypothetical protein
LFRVRVANIEWPASICQFVVRKMPDKLPPCDSAQNGNPVKIISFIVVYNHATSSRNPLPIVGEEITWLNKI